MIFSCFSAKVQVGFHIEIEYENDDISKLKTTACSNEDNKPEILKNLRVFCEIMHDNINVSKDFLYLRDTETILENKLTISSLNQDFIQSIDVKNSQKCDYGSSKFSLKRIFFNKPYQIIYFRVDSTNPFLKIVDQSLKFKIVKRAKKIIMGNQLNSTYDCLIIDEENPDFYKLNQDHPVKYFNLQKFMENDDANMNKISKIFNSKTLHESRYNSLFKK